MAETAAVRVGTPVLAVPVQTDQRYNVEARESAATFASLLRSWLTGKDV